MDSFYSDLPLLDSFFQLSDPARFHPLPGNWYVAVTDIVNSTGAVEKGRYKRVNILGASPIVGMLNLENKDDIPYTFAGDGCSFCIPPSLLNKAREVLAASKAIGEHQYGLDLRAAVIPIRRIRKAGFDVQIARYRVSKAYSQAIFSGGGLTYAENLLKNAGKDEYIIASAGSRIEADFTGLECRWQEVGQQGKKVITMLVKANPSAGNKGVIYEQVLRKMREIFGFDDNTNPIDPARLNMNMSLQSLMGEIKFRTFGMSRMQRIMYMLKVKVQVMLGKLFMTLGYESADTNWSLYKPDLALNSDHRKFDDMLRVVISGTEEQFQQLQQFLEQKFEAGRLAYGFHLSETAMITCMVFKYHRQHIHFVDGSGGGYATAAGQLKKRMERLLTGA
ncbi:DUF3095 domain-containing protein [Halalkalibaculum sp. DA3122]|uniref:DUF3095 domain-containing protein n=1 Tax=Halalkalibaculum sp. DA3122 TaxID=3373607 RepID=UPI003754132F